MGCLQSRPTSGRKSASSKSLSGRLRTFGANARSSLSPREPGNEGRRKSSDKDAEGEAKAKEEKRRKRREKRKQEEALRDESYRQYLTAPVIACPGALRQRGRVEVRAFEVAHVAVRLLRLHASLADAEVAEFRRGVLLSPGIATLVTEDPACAWAIAAADKQAELRAVAQQVLALSEQSSAEAAQRVAAALGGLQPDASFPAAALAAAFWVPEAAGQQAAGASAAAAEAAPPPAGESAREARLVGGDGEEGGEGEELEGRPGVEEGAAAGRGTEARRSAAQLSPAEQPVEWLEFRCDQTTELYHEMASLENLRSALHKRLADKSRASKPSIIRDLIEHMQADMELKKASVQEKRCASLWDQPMALVVAVMADVVALCYARIVAVFSPETLGPRPLLAPSPAAPSSCRQLGVLGMDLHYANVIAMLDKMVSHTRTLPHRDALFASLPPPVLHELRLQLTAPQEQPLPPPPQLRADLEGVLDWLASMAQNTIKIGVDRRLQGHTELSLLETLFHADEARMQRLLVRLLLALHRLVEAQGGPALQHTAAAAAAAALEAESREQQQPPQPQQAQAGQLSGGGAAMAAAVAAAVAGLLGDEEEESVEGAASAAATQEKAAEGSAAAAMPLPSARALPDASSALHGSLPFFPASSSAPVAPSLSPQEAAPPPPGSPSPAAPAPPSSASPPPPAPAQAEGSRQESLGADSRFSASPPPLPPLHPVHSLPPAGAPLSWFSPSPLPPAPRKGHQRPHSFAGGRRRPASQLVPSSCPRPGLRREELQRALRAVQRSRGGSLAEGRLPLPRLSHSMEVRRAQLSSSPSFSVRPEQPAPKAVTAPLSLRTAAAVAAMDEPAHVAALLVSAADAEEEQPGAGDGAAAAVGPDSPHLLWHSLSAAFREEQEERVRALAAPGAVGGAQAPRLKARELSRLKRRERRGEEVEEAVLASAGGGAGRGEGERSLRKSQSAVGERQGGPHVLLRQSSSTDGSGAAEARRHRRPMTPLLLDIDNIGGGGEGEEGGEGELAGAAGQEGGPGAVGGSEEAEQRGGSARNSEESGPLGPSRCSTGGEREEAREQPPAGGGEDRERTAS